MSNDIIDVPVETVDDGGPQKIMPVVVLGDDSPLRKACLTAFKVPVGTDVTFNTMEEIDLVVEKQPGLVIFTDSLKVKKNNTLDDTDLINACQKLIKMTQSGILVRSTLNVETTERLIMGLGKPAFDAKIVYMPDTTNSNNVAELISPEIQYVGGTPDAVKSLMGILTNLSHFSAGEVKNGNVFEVVYANLAVAGARLVKQTFFDEFHKSVLDLKNANPMIVRRLIERHPALTDPSIAIPLSVLGVDEHDSNVFNGATDTLTVLDAALIAQRKLRGEV